MALPPRFWRRVDVTDGCWQWKTPMSDGYGRIQIGWVRKRSHVWVWEALHGPKPEGMQLDHLCRNRACCNPAHLRLATPRENALAPGSLCPGKINAEKTHCPQGHPYDELNTMPVKNKWRDCRECHNRRDRARRARRRQTDLLEMVGGA